MKVRFLDPTLINQIAAGEVIERPASAIKELVENSIDAGATKIDIILRDGGKTYICIIDNGGGMSAEDLALCVERHATSKIPDNDLFNIQTLGFRGEALPSIGSVSRLKITSRQQGSETAWELVVEGGAKSEAAPAAGDVGTKIEVRDLFYATPARLKFLKAAATELSHIVDIIERLALINPEIDFTVTDGERRVLSFIKGINRIEGVLGKDFHANCCPIGAQRQDLTLKGWVSIPTYNHSSASNQYFFVNGRPVKDKLLATAIRVAYQDVLAGNRYPSLCLFLICPPDEVDINVHPAKAEVRFRDPNSVRSFVISAIREVLRGTSNQSSTVLSSGIIQAFTAPVVPSSVPAATSPMPRRDGGGFIRPTAGSSSPNQARLSIPEKIQDFDSFSEQLLAPLQAPTVIAAMPQPQMDQVAEQDNASYLGHAKAQIHETYIVAETKDHLVIVDQHAAHERLVYEKMKQDFASGLIKRQALLIPEIIELSELHMSLLQPHLANFNSLGFTIEVAGKTGLVLREIPMLLNKSDLKQLIHDMVSELKDQDTALSMKQTIHEILADKACKNSIRAGRKLSGEEMNALLRQMEATPSSSQCNHGRPTFVKLDKHALERLFGRT
ncbi:DNA mismatch repair endonuclease MutL [Candidatus Paracaedibacter symbiosus]|uniref:DNA mismatch repair endonuclease MutL n=1 Tax=Candidatus Paracaedibacter symbiosus TaxID=244582 RepID=UPI0005096905|nr:DNA mismatch repair endonuclease MutL [Candidatus Paracaedibacter symbiosus]